MTRRYTSPLSEARCWSARLMEMIWIFWKPLRSLQEQITLIPTLMVLWCVPKLDFKLSIPRGNPKQLSRSHHLATQFVYQLNKSVSITAEKMMARWLVKNYRTETRCSIATKSLAVSPTYRSMRMIMSWLFHRGLAVYTKYLKTDGSTVHWLTSSKKLQNLAAFCITPKRIWSWCTLAATRSKCTNLNDVLMDNIITYMKHGTNKYIINSV